MQDNHRRIAVWVVPEWWLRDHLHTVYQPRIIPLEETSNLRGINTLQDVAYLDQDLLLAQDAELVALDLHLRDMLEQV